MPSQLSVTPSRLFVSQHVCPATSNNNGVVSDMTLESLAENIDTALTGVLGEYFVEGKLLGTKVVASNEAHS